MNGQLIGATPLVAQRKQRRARPGTSLLDDLAAQRALGRGHVVSADHRVEHLIGDANRQEQVHIHAGVGELAEGRRAGAGPVAPARQMGPVGRR